MFYIQQTHENGCGFACLKMMLANIRKDERYLFLPEKEEKSLTYKDLLKLAKEQGLNLCGFKVEDKSEVAKQRIFPMILRISPVEGVFHAILVTKIKRGIVHYLDPAEGQMKMPLYKFCKIWDGTGLMIEEDNGGGFAYQIDEPTKKHNLIKSSIAQIISGIACILSIYFIKSSTPLVIPVICISIFILAEIYLKSCLFKDMKNKDDFYMKDLKIPNSCFEQFFKKLEKFKALSVINPVNFIKDFVVAIFIIFISIFNGLHNLPLILMPLVLTLIDIFMFIPWKKDKDLKIQILESKLPGSEDCESFSNNLRKIHSKAYSLGASEVYKRYLYIFLMIIVSFLVTTLSGTFDITNVAFSLLIQIIMYDYTSKLLSYSDKKKELDAAKANLINAIHQNDENN